MPFDYAKANALWEQAREIEQEMLSACRLLRRAEMQKDRNGVTWFRKLLRERTDRYFAARKEHEDERNRQIDNARQERLAHDVLTNEGAPAPMEFH
jgi:hypothetical protein